MSVLSASAQAMVQGLVDEVRGALGADLVGIYLGGSLAWGCYAARGSDLDLVVLTRGDATEHQRARLADVHRRLLQDYPEVHQLDYTYVPLRAQGGYGDGTFPYGRDGAFHTTGGGVDPMTWHTLHTCGIPVWGPPAATVVPPVSAEVLRGNMLRNLAYLSRRLPDYVDMGSEEVAFGVLTFCRVVYTLRTGEIPGKVQAARWAQEWVSIGFQPLLRWALEQYQQGHAWVQQQAAGGQGCTGGSGIPVGYLQAFAAYMTRVGGV